MLPSWSPITWNPKGSSQVTMSVTGLDYLSTAPSLTRHFGLLYYRAAERQKSRMRFSDQHPCIVFETAGSPAVLREVSPYVSEFLHISAEIIGLS
jgi:hypothetical protein